MIYFLIIFLAIQEHNYHYIIVNKNILLFGTIKHYLKIPANKVYIKHSALNIAII